MKEAEAYQSHNRCNDHCTSHCRPGLLCLIMKPGFGLKN